MDILSGCGAFALQVVESAESKARSLTWQGLKRVLAAYAFAASTSANKAYSNCGLA